MNIYLKCDVFFFFYSVTISSLVDLQSFRHISTWYITNQHNYLKIFFLKIFFYNLFQDLLCLPLLILVTPNGKIALMKVFTYRFNIKRNIPINYSFMPANVSVRLKYFVYMYSNFINYKYFYDTYLYITHYLTSLTYIVVMLVGQLHRKGFTLM